MVLDTTLLNTQHYKLRIKGKVDPSKDVVATEKGAFGSSSITIANFTYIYIYIYIYICVCVCVCDEMKYAFIQ